MREKPKRKLKNIPPPRNASEEETPARYVLRYDFRHMRERGRLRQGRRLRRLSILAIIIGLAFAFLLYRLSGGMLLFFFLPLPFFFFRYGGRGSMPRARRFGRFRRPKEVAFYLDERALVVKRIPGGLTRLPREDIAYLETEQTERTRFNPELRPRFHVLVVYQAGERELLVPNLPPPHARYAVQQLNRRLNLVV